MDYKLRNNTFAKLVDLKTVRYGTESITSAKIWNPQPNESDR